MTDEAAIQLVYLVVGAQTAICLSRVTNRLVGESVYHPLTHRGGHIGMVEDLRPFANAVAAYIEEQTVRQDFPGVFEYEVTEALGEWIAKTAETGNAVIKESDFAAKLKELGDRFFA